MALSFVLSAMYTSSSDIFIFSERSRAIRRRSSRLYSVAHADVTISNARVLTAIAFFMIFPFIRSLLPLPLPGIGAFSLVFHCFLPLHSPYPSA
ncbi:MAG: hypothetical protein A4E65_00121 [Syntrophorhabdus sp. PtaU1.Bin153]|nr:MAG: hypothetical protein A4E65_00121 [Syntrophorhabdus sp. PtaU1.Bin153]